MKKATLLFLPFPVCLGIPLPTVPQDTSLLSSTSPTEIKINNIHILENTIINTHDQYHYQHQQRPVSHSDSQPSPPPPHPSGPSPKTTTTITITKPPPSPPSPSKEDGKEGEESPWKWNLSDGTTPPEVLPQLGSGTTANPESKSESEPSEPEPDSDSESELGTGAVPSTSSSTSTADSIINENVKISPGINNNEIHENDDAEFGEDRHTTTQLQNQDQDQMGHGRFLPPPTHNNINNLNHPTPSSPSGSQTPDADPESDSPTKEEETETIPVRKTYFRHLRHADVNVSTRSNALLNAHADRIAVVGVLVLVPVSVLVVWMGEFLSRVWEERMRGRRTSRSRSRGRGRGSVWLG